MKCRATTQMRVEGKNYGGELAASVRGVPTTGWPRIAHLSRSLNCKDLTPTAPARGLGPPQKRRVPAEARITPLTANSGKAPSLPANCGP
jgi:hypothetical protein